MKLNSRLIAFFFVLLPLQSIASDDDGDILDRRDVQELLFGVNAAKGESKASTQASTMYWQVELATEGERASAGLYLTKKAFSYIKGSGGILYHGRTDDSSDSIEARAYFLLEWDRFFLQPFAGLATHFTITKNERELSSNPLVGADLQLTKSLGISARHSWRWTLRTWMSRKPSLETSLSEPDFELAFYWRI